MFSDVDSDNEILENGEKMAKKSEISDTLAGEMLHKKEVRMFALAKCA